MKNYFITSSSDVNAFYRNTTTLSFQKNLDMMCAGCGVPKKEVPVLSNGVVHLDRTRPETVTYPASGLNMQEFVGWIYKRQLAVDKSKELWGIFLPALVDGTSSSKLCAMKDAAHGSGGVTIKLRQLLESSMSEPMTKMLFGSRLLTRHPELLTFMHSFIDDMWKLAYSYPYWMILGRESTLRIFDSYIDDEMPLIEAGNSDASWLVQTLLKGHKESGMSRRCGAGLLTAVYMAALANVHAAAYWMFCHILYDQHLKSALLKECAPAFQTNELDVQYIQDKCPLLDSAFREILRLHVTSNTGRFIDAPTRIGDKVLEPGNFLVLPLRHLGHLQTIWGGDHAAYNPTRFLKNKQLESHPVYRPFGGGPLLCPGKRFATRTVLTYVAYLLHTLDIELESKEAPFPELAHNTSAFGVSVPKLKTDPKIRIKRKADSLPVTAVA